jgi:hypothetical protein
LLRDDARQENVIALAAANIDGTGSEGVVADLEPQLALLAGDDQAISLCLHEWYRNLRKNANPLGRPTMRRVDKLAAFAALFAAANDDDHQQAG